jgi:hypothetical protein
LIEGLHDRARDCPSPADINRQKWSMGIDDVEFMQDLPAGLSQFETRKRKRHFEAPLREGVSTL